MNRNELVPMLMNRVETLVVNSPPRHWLQRWYEVPLLIQLGGRTHGARVVEIGCGAGYGTRLILDQFGAATVDAVDLDPAMINRARRRLSRYTGVTLAEGSATDLRTAFNSHGGGKDADYDAAFGFGIIHHIPHWREAVTEIARVLKPGGRFFFDEVTATALARPSFRLLTDHPDEDRFTAGEFLAELPHHGLHTGDNWCTRIGGDYLFGVARRNHAQ